MTRSFVSGRSGCIESGFPSPGNPNAALGGTSARCWNVNPETLRNWAEERDGRETSSTPAPRSAESEEVRALRRRVPSSNGRTRSSRPRPRFSPRRSSTADSMIMDYIDSYREWFGVEPVCAVWPRPGFRSRRPTLRRSKAQLTDAELDEAYMANRLRSIVAEQLGHLRGAEAVACGPPRRPHIGRD